MQTRRVAYHLHAGCPKTPSIPSRIPEAMSEPKALLSMLPHVRAAVRKPSSLRLYHFERRNNAPCHSVRTCAKYSPVMTHWKKRTLANTQEEARQKSPGKVAGDPSQDRDETPKDHANGEVYGGFPDTIEEHIPVPRDAEN
jgi:hypothetical protein